MPFDVVTMHSMGGGDISMARCKTTVTPLLPLRKYYTIALNHRIYDYGIDWYTIISAKKSFIAKNNSDKYIYIYIYIYIYVADNYLGTFY